MANFARHASTVGAGVAAEPSASLLHDNGTSIIAGALHALDQTSSGRMGVKPVLDTNILDFVHMFFESNDRKVMFRSDVDVVEDTIHALSRISNDVNGANTVLQVHTLAYTLELLQSPNSKVRTWACLLLGNLARHNSRHNSTLRAVVTVWSSLSDNSVVEDAIYALAQISNDPNGAKAVWQARAVDFTPELLQSPNTKIQTWACLLLGNLAWHDSTMGAVVTVQHCVRLVGLLRGSDGDIDVVKNAIYALAMIADSADGVKSVLEARTLDFIPELLRSPHEEVRKWVCWMLGSLPRSDSTSPAEGVVHTKLCIQLVTRVHDENIHVAEDAGYIIGQIATDPHGAAALISAGALDYVLPLLQSQNSGIRHHTCWMLGSLVQHPFAAGAVLAVEPEFSSTFLFGHVSSQASDNNISVVEGAIYALSQISRASNANSSGVDAKASNVAQEILESTDDALRRLIGAMLGDLLLHDNMAEPGAMLSVQPFSRLVALLRRSEDDDDVLVTAIFAIIRIARNLRDTEAAVKARALDSIHVQTESRNGRVQQWASEMMGGVVRHVSKATAVLAAELCVQLVTLLGEKKIHAVDGAIFALSEISRDEAKAVLDANALGFIQDLLDSPRMETWRSTWSL
ncbi:armadillo-type protein [Mycena crocata]|nr:armadillo-type protein [Mycena crocata]